MTQGAGAVQTSEALRNLAKIPAAHWTPGQREFINKLITIDFCVWLQQEFDYLILPEGLSLEEWNATMPICKSLVNG